MPSGQLRREVQAGETTSAGASGWERYEAAGWIRSQQVTVRNERTVAEEGSFGAAAFKGLGGGVCDGQWLPLTGLLGV